MRISESASTSRPTWRAACLVLSLLLGLVAPVRAADRCQPTVELPTGRVLAFPSGESDIALRLEATLAQDLILTLPHGSAKSGLLQDDLAVRGVALGSGKLQGSSIRLVTGQARGTLLARTDSQRMLIRVEDGKAWDIDGRMLELEPVLNEASDFVVAKGAQLVVSDGTEVRVQAGALLHWSPQPGAAMRASLPRGSRFNETPRQGEEARLTLSPARQARGGKLILSLSNTRLDLSKQAPAFCLVGADSDADATTLAARFIGQQGDTASFELVIPKLARTESLAQPPGRDVFGTPTRIRALAYADGHPVLDVHADLAISEPWQAVAAGLGMLLLIYAAAAYFKRTFNPLVIVQQLIVHGETGRYSVSNLQILMWTLLVIFALGFSWWSTDMLLELRPDILQLLGITGGAHVLGRGVERLSATPPRTTTPVGSDLFSSPQDDSFDLLRFQMLAFTIFAWVYAGASVIQNHGLPELPQSLFWLMGLGNLAYVAGKVPGAMGANTPAQTTQTILSRNKTDLADFT